MILQTQIMTTNTSPQTLSSASLVNVTDMAFDLISGATYYYAFYLSISVATAITGGPGVAITYASATYFTGHGRWPSVATASTNAQADIDLTVLGSTPVIGSSINVASTSLLFSLHGIIKTSAAGTFQLQMSENPTGISVLPIVIAAGGVGTLRRVA